MRQKRQNANKFVPDSIAEPLVWSVLECTISIVCISIPPMRPLFAKAAPGMFEDHGKVKKQISRHIGGIAAAARHPRKSMMLALPTKPSSPMGGRGANSAHSSQRQLQLIPSFEKIETPLGPTETVVISLREMENDAHLDGKGARHKDDEEASIEGKNSNGDRQSTIA